MTLEIEVEFLFRPSKPNAFWKNTCTESKTLMIYLEIIEHLSRLQPIQFLESVFYEPMLNPTDDIEQLDQISLSTIDLVLTPGLAFSSNFSRLGQGKGHYGNTVIIVLT